MALTQLERTQYKAWMEQAATAVHAYNGSEIAEQQLFEPMLAMDAFIRSKNHNLPSLELERAFAQEAWPENSAAAQGFNGFLEEASQAYLRKLRAANDYERVLSILQQGGAVVKRHAAIFVKTHGGGLRITTTPTPKPVEFETQSRLAMLIEHLKAEGIYTDDIIAHVCTPDPGMMRKLPYIVLHIPRLDKEIAVCDQVGEITFVANKSLGTDVWTHLSKDQLKARPEVAAIKFTNEEEWWNGIRQVLMAERSQPGPKVDVHVVAGKKPPLDVGLIKQCILAHRLETGKWPRVTSEMVQYGLYAEKLLWKRIDSALRIGLRGLPRGSSLAALCEIVSQEHALDYFNHLNQPDYDLRLIKQSILAHRQATGSWPTQKLDTVQYGPYAGKEKWKALEGALGRGSRGLLGGSSLASLNEEVSKEHKLDYVHPRHQSNFEINKIKACILAYRQAKGEWPKMESGDVEHEPYAAQTTWKKIYHALREGNRGLPDGLSLATVCEQVSQEHGLDYVNYLHQENYEIDKIKASILAHRQQTGSWPAVKSGVIKYGPCTGILWSTINSALHAGVRGLPGGSSIATLSEEISKEQGLNYVKDKHTAKVVAEKAVSTLRGHDRCQ